jgi:hypothetical protein
MKNSTASTKNQIQKRIDQLNNLIQKFPNVASLIRRWGFELTVLEGRLEALKAVVAVETPKQLTIWDIQMSNTESNASFDSTKIMTEIVQKSSKASWGGIIDGGFSEIWEKLKQLESLGLAKNLTGLRYQVEINNLLYVVRENDGNWQVMSKPKTAKKTPILRQEFLDYCYECGYNVAVINGKCVSCI